MNTQELVQRLRADADFIDADTYDECWEVKETPRGKMLRAAACRLSEMDAENKGLREALRMFLPESDNGLVSFSEAIANARAALEHQP